MKSTFRILFYLRRDKQKADGTIPIWCRITVDGEATRFNTKSSIYPNFWDTTVAKAIGKTKEVMETNALLDSIKAGIYKVYYDLQERENNVTAERIKNIFLGIEIKRQYLLELFKCHNEDVEKLIGISKSKATYQKYEVTRKHITNFIKEKYNVSDISLKEINHMFISDLEVYLLTTAGCRSNTTAKFMQFLKRIIIIARNNGWIRHDPFANYKIRICKVDRGYLTQGEIETIMQKKFASTRLEQVRDIFIFSCYTGLAYIDVKGLREKNIRTSFDGNLWVMTKRQKTNVSANIPLLDVPKQILNKYRGALPNGIVLPVLSNQKMNAYLKEIGDVCGIDKTLTFHLARHTFATTVTLAKGVPIETVSKMLGHTNIKTTQIYARITDSKIGNDMALLAAKLKEAEIKKQIPVKSRIDILFDCLSSDEKMVLFNLPQCLSYDSERESRVYNIWYTLSDAEKSSLWKNAFENNEILPGPKVGQELTINQ
jgi:site-specific recombinase XerD